MKRVKKSLNKMLYLWLCKDSLREMARNRMIERKHEKDGSAQRGFG